MNSKNKLNKNNKMNNLNKKEKVKQEKNSQNNNLNNKQTMMPPKLLSDLDLIFKFIRLLTIFYSITHYMRLISYTLNFYTYILQNSNNNNLCYWDKVYMIVY